MATAGRKPKPAAIKKLEGNPGKREIKEDVKGTGKAPKCPNWLMPDAKAEWKRLISIFESVGVIDEIDLNAFAGYCQSYARWKEAEEFLSKEGLVFRTPSGYVQQWPQVSIARQNKTDMLKFATEFGLTPSARTRISLFSKENNDVDPMEKLLSE